MIETVDIFSDIHSQNIMDFGSIDTGLVMFSRPYDFTLSGNSFSLTGINYFEHLFDQSIYPSTLTSATGFAVFATVNNSSSGYYYTAMMQLFLQGALASPQGLFSVTSLTSSVTSTNFINIGRFNPNVYQGDTTIYQTFSASLTSCYIYNFDRSIYGDKIYDSSLSLYHGSTLVAYDWMGEKNAPLYSLSSSLYASDTLTSVTRFWVFPDVGKIITWSSDPTIMSSLSAVDSIQFRNSLAVANTTINIRIEPEEFNASDNNSFYVKDYLTGQVPDTWITAIYLMNPWNDILAVCKIPKPIRKTANVPITFKISIDTA